MSTRMLRNCLAALMLVTITYGTSIAQCSTCATPTVAYSPVVSQPVVAQPTVAYRPYTGWYPGKWLDQWRLRRAGVATTAPAYTAAYAPSYTANYTAGYAPTYTASYAPTYTTSYAPTYTAASYTAAYRPYVTSYAPLSAPVASSCNTCTQTLARPVLMRPVVASACDTCSYTPSCGCSSCGGCDTCSTGLSQAVYSEPSSGCSSCGGGSTVTNVLPPSSAPSSVGQPNVGPPTTQPSLAPVPQNQSQYNSQRPIQGSGNGAADPAINDVDPLDQYDPGPVDSGADSSTWYNAPQLLDPRDRTATRTYRSNRPTVDVHTAVYRSTERPQRVNQTSGQRARTQAEIDADGWSSGP